MFETTGAPPSADAWRAHMRRGNFQTAWEIADRAMASPAARGIDVPAHMRAVWDGKSPDGRSVLVHCNHGLGDTVQFVRYAAPLRQRARRVTLLAQGALLELLETVEGVDEVLTAEDREVPSDDREVEMEITELSHVFRSTLDNLPARVPYLQVEPADLSRDQERMAVGLVWRVGEWEPKRSLPLWALIDTVKADVDWYILQRGPGLAECPVGFGTHCGFDDVVRAASVMRALDLVISVDSFPAHLSGALGVPTWTLLDANADWRWLEGRDDSPWYPTMRLFRQAEPGDWRPLLQRLDRELTALNEISSPAG